MKIPKFIYITSVFIFGLTLLSCGSKTPSSQKQVNTTVDSNYVMSAAYGTDDSLYQMLGKYREEKNKKMHAVLTTTKVGFTKERPSSNLTNLMADICVESAPKLNTQKVDFGLVNFGGIRSSIPKGKVRLEDAYKLMPFDNELCLLKIKGDSVQSMIHYIRKRDGEPISGMQLVFENETIKSAKINGKTFNNKMDYWLVTSDYLANGGDRMIFLSNPISRIDLGVKYRDVIIDYFKEKDVIISNTEQRIIYGNK